ncbi:MAG: hypothetical protein GEU73_07500 [Chloroflexi bacterium]|nr:hypothetical protein [Chloroflexota bacterium]
MAVPVLSRRSRVVALAVAILVAALAGAAVFATIVGGTTGAPDTAVLAEESEPIGGAQATSTAAQEPGQNPRALHPSRDRLAICVQAVRGAEINPDEARARVQAALAEAAKHPRWDQVGYGRAEPVVDVGCPFEPAGLDPETLFYSMVGIPIPGTKRVERPGPYRLAVWILPPAEFERLLPTDAAKRRGRRPVQESMLCEGYEERCGAATTGLNLSTEEFADPASLDHWIERGMLGGTDPAPIPTPDPRIPPGFRPSTDEMNECREKNRVARSSFSRTDCVLWAIEQRGGSR